MILTIFNLCSSEICYVMMELNHYHFHFVLIWSMWHDDGITSNRHLLDLYHYWPFSLCTIWNKYSVFSWIFEKKSEIKVKYSPVDVGCNQEDGLPSLESSQTIVADILVTILNCYSRLWIERINSSLYLMTTKTLSPGRSGWCAKCAVGSSKTMSWEMSD